MPHAIVVNVPEPKATCFVAIPFVDDLLPLSDLIERAANGRKLQTIRTDQTAGAADFVHDIVVNIRAARVVVAVCSPEASTGRPNPNVLYELGLAHALGKPTLIVTSDAASLPSDLLTKYYLPYSPAALANRRDADHFERKLREALSDLLARSTNQLTDPSWEGVAVAEARHRFLLDPVFWDSFRAILAFGKEIHDQLQALDTGHLDGLLREISTLVFQTFEDQARQSRIGGFIGRWSEYQAYYDRVTVPKVFDRLDRTLKGTDECLKRLPDDLTGTTGIAIDRSKKFYAALKQLLHSYPLLHQTVSSKSQFAPLLEVRATSQQIHGEIQSLSTTAKQCILQADRLMTNLIDIML